MIENETSASPWASRVLSILRIVVGFLFMAHGTQKLFLVPAGQMPHPVELFSLFGLAGILETFGGLLILIGLCTRWAAFVLCGEMAVAYFIGHAPHGPLPLLNKGELAVLYCFVYLYLVFAGGGAWSLDVLLRRRKAAKP